MRIAGGAVGPGAPARPEGRRMLAVVAALLAVAMVGMPFAPSPAGAGPDVDASFGDGGARTIDDRRSPHDGAMAVRPDGSIDALVATAGGDLELVRLTPDGDVDTTFGTDGRVALPLDEGPLGFLSTAQSSLVATPTGTIVAGSARLSAGSHLLDAPALVRVSEDGTSVSPPVPFAPPGATTPSVRFRSFANTGGHEVYAGNADLGEAANRCSSVHRTWKKGANTIEIVYDPAADTLRTIVNNAVDECTGFAGPDVVPQVDLHLVDRDAGTVSVRDVTVNGVAFGTFEGEGEFHHDLSGYPLDGPVRITATVHLSGSFSTSQEKSRVEFGFDSRFHGDAIEVVDDGDGYLLIGRSSSLVPWENDLLAVLRVDGSLAVLDRDVVDLGTLSGSQQPIFTGAAAARPGGGAYVVTSRPFAMDLVALGPDGRPDPAFAGDGHLALTVRTDTRPSIAVLDDGTVLVGGDGDGGGFVHAIDPAGNRGATVPLPIGGDGDREARWVALLPTGDGTLVGAVVVERDDAPRQRTFDHDPGRVLVGLLTGDGFEPLTDDPADEEPYLLDGDAASRVALAGAGTGGSVVATTTSSGDARFVRVGERLVVESVTTAMTPATAEGTDAGRRETYVSGLAGAVTFAAGDAESVQTSPYRLNPYRLNPYRLNPYRLNPYRLNPWRLNPYRLNPWRLNPWRLNTTLRGLALTDLELTAEPYSWSERLEGTDLAGLPAQSVTVGDAYDLIDAGRPSPLDGLTMADVLLESTVLADSSVAALLLIGVPIADLPGDVCAALGPDQPACAAFDPATTQLLDLELAGLDLAPYLARPLSLTQADITGSPLATASIGDIDLSQTVFGELAVADLPAGFVDPTRCTPTTEVPNTDPARTCTTLFDAQLLHDGVGSFEDETGLVLTATVGDLIDAVVATGLLPDVTLAGVAAGFAPSGEVPVGDLPQDAVLDQAEIRSDPATLYEVATTVEVSCGAGDLVVEHRASDRSRLAPGSATYEVVGGSGPEPLEPAADGTFVVPASVCDGATAATVVVAGRYEPGAELGTFSVASAAWTGDAVDEAIVSAPAALRVLDGPEPADDHPTSAPMLEEGVLYAGHVSYAGDQDVFRARIPDDARPGDLITFNLWLQDVDYDLAVAGGADQGLIAPYRLNPYRLNPYRLNPYRLNPYRLNPYRLNVLDDDTDEPGYDGSSTAPEHAADIPIVAALSEAGTIRGTSINRDSTRESVTVVVRPGDQGETLLVGTGAYDGGFSTTPYLLSMTTRPAPPLPECEFPVDHTVASPGTLPSLPIGSDVETIILVAPSRQPGLDLDLVQRVADRDDVNGVVLPVDGDRFVREAYDAWDADPCDVGARKDVVSEILALVASAIIVDGEDGGGTYVNDSLRHVVVVGSDTVIPQDAVVDGTTLGHESQHAFEVLSDGGRLNPISAALGNGYVLTDDVYGTLATIDGVEGDDAHVPVLAVGRVVESGAEANDVFQQFVDRDGVLAPTEAFTTGYDFLADGAVAIDAQLRPAVGDAGATLLADDTWGPSDVIDGVNDTAGGYVSVNAHYDQTHLLPASGLADPSQVVSTSDAFLDDLAGAVLFTSGCHAGLSVTDYVSSETVKTQDWAQDSAQRGALFVGNTGYGYGDTDTVAGSERLFELAAANLAGGEMTAGQAFVFAKQEYLAGLKPVSAIDQKVATEVTMFGLPMYRIGATGGVAESPLADVPGPFPASDEVVAVTGVTTTARTGAGGTTYFDVEAPGFETTRQATKDRPLGSNLVLDLGPGAPLKGVVLDALVTVDGDPVDPAIHTPASDLASSAIEREFDDLTFPVQLVDRRGYQAPTGLVDRAILSGVQWTTDGAPGSGLAVPRTIADGTALRIVRNDDPDFTPPVLQRTDAYVVPDGATTTAVFQARTTGGAVSGHVLFRLDTDPVDGPWRRVDFVDLGGEVFGAAAPGLPGSTTAIVEYILQLGDEAGNHLWSSEKGPGYEGALLPGGGIIGSARLVPDRGPDAAGVYTGAAPVVTLVDLDPAVNYTVRVDGAELADYDGSPIAIPDAEGVHTVGFEGDDGSFGLLVVIIDRSGPVIEATLDPAGPTAGPVTVTFRCRDAGAGVATCPDPVTVESSTTLSVSATDRAGNVGAASVDVVIDDEAPTIVATVTPPADASGWHTTAPTITYTCDDGDGSGVASCPAPVTVTTEGTTTVTRVATDNVGNTASSTTVVRLDRVAPTGSITSSPILLLSQPVTGTATDLTSGVASVQVRFTRGGTTTVADATLSCTDGSCTWQVPNPGGFLAIYSVEAVATDVAGNTATIATQTLTLSIGGFP